MRSTLFYIPHELAGVPVFGWGWLLGGWLLFSIVLLAGLVRRQGWNDDTRSYLPLCLMMAAAIGLLLPWLEEVSPATGLKLGLPIRGYGVMVMLGVVSGVALAARRAGRMGVDPEQIFSLALWLFVGGIAGARTFYVVQFWNEFRRPSLGETIAEIARFTQGGLVVYGALIGGMIAALTFMRRRRLPVWAMLDLMAPSFVLGLALGRVGCFLNGCCYGGLCDLPVAVTFPPSSPPYQDQWFSGLFAGVRLASPADGGDPRVAYVDPNGPARDAGLTAGTTIASLNGQPAAAWSSIVSRLADGGELTVETTDGKTHRWRAPPFPRRSLPVHPVQLYAAIDAGLLFAVLWLYYPFRRRDGEVFALLLLVHPVSRFLQEMIRNDGNLVFGTAVTISQYLSVAMFALALAIWGYLARQPRGSVLPAV